MIKVAIFSDNHTLINSWASALSSQYKVEKIEEINADTSADAIIIDANNIDSDEMLFSIFNKISTRFLVVGTDWPEQKQIKALVYGAVGYCGTTEPPELLKQAIDCVLKGDIWIQRHLVPKVIGILVQMNKSSLHNQEEISKSENSVARLQTLSNREKDVANMIHEGESNKNIAESLNISERTVKAHLTSIYKKLNVTDRLHLALFIKEFS